MTHGANSKDTMLPSGAVMREKKKVNRWVEVSLAQLRGHLEVTALEADAQSLLAILPAIPEEEKDPADPDVDISARNNSLREYTLVLNS